MSDTICENFFFERKRLKYNQKDISNFLGMSSKQIGRGGTTHPIPSDKLVELEKMGFDIGFVLTGKRKEVDLQLLATSIEYVEFAYREKFLKADFGAKAIAISTVYDALSRKTYSGNKEDKDIKELAKGVIEESNKLLEFVLQSPESRHGVTKFL